MSLFPDLDPIDAAPVETVSAGRRLTLRQKTDVERGIHPLTRDRVRDGDETCGSCAHRRRAQFAKCDLGPRSRGPATDVRAWWPACRRWESIKTDAPAAR